MLEAREQGRQEREEAVKKISLLAAGILLVAGLASLARAETVQKGSLRVSFVGRLSPSTLPRSGSAPVHVAVGTQIDALKGKRPPRLRAMTIAINRNGRFDPDLLPKCTLRDIQPSTTENALLACGSSLVGRGRFAAEVLLSRQAPFPSEGELYAFNGEVDGHPAILAHVYGEKPVPTSFTLVFELRKSAGTFGTVLRASLPNVTGDSGYITGLSLRLGATARSHGKVRSYLSASCPAPDGFTRVPFPFAKVSLDFGATKVRSVLTRNCKVSG
jgi:hypothetical protein